MFCETCPNSYHAYCLTPPLTELPPVDEETNRFNWNCPRCLLVEPNNKVEKILSWRFVEIKYPEPADPEDLLKEGETEASIDEERRYRLMLQPPTAMPPRRERELFIKWKYMSYWHCAWVSFQNFFFCLKLKWKTIDNKKLT